METEIDWYHLFGLFSYFSEKRLSPSNEVSQILINLPREKWKYTWSITNTTLLHCATFLNDFRAVCSLLEVMSTEDIDVLDYEGRSAIYIAAKLGEANILEMLIAAGSNYRQARGYYLARSSPLEISIKMDHHTCVQLLYSNGARCHGSPYWWISKTYQGIDECRDIIVILLGLKKRRHILCKLDRFLIRQVLAVEIWLTRTDKTWGNHNFQYC